MASLSDSFPEYYSFATNIAIEPHAQPCISPISLAFIFILPTMSYQHLDDQPPEAIPLQDLAADGNENESLSEYADDSDSSQMFDEIASYNRKRQVVGDFTESPSYQRIKDRFFGTNQVLKRLLVGISVGAVLLWLVALIVYSNGRARKVTSDLWHGGSTNIVALENRNVSLNTYLAQLANVSMAEYRKGVYFPDEKVVRWLTEAQRPSLDDHMGNKDSGFYLTRVEKSFVVRQVGTDYSRTIRESPQFEAFNNFFYVEDMLLNPGAAADDQNTWHLLRSDLIPQWRHLSFALYWLWNPSTASYKPILPKTEKEGKERLEKVHFATFNPSGDKVTFGHNHDLYLLDIDTMDITRVTDTGSLTVFNGKPDWVYEEDVYPHAMMLWWSSDLKHLAYATIDDTNVKEYDMDYYVKESDKVGMSYESPLGDKVDDVNQYPLRSSIRYPKPGTLNPIVSMSVYDTDSGETLTIGPLSDDEIGHDFILYDAKWIDDNSLLLKVSDRTSSILKKKAFLLSEKKLQSVHTTNSSAFNGWIEKAQPITIIESDKKNKYIDRIVSDDRVQLAVFELATTDKPSKIIGSIHSSSPVAYNAVDEEIYFLTEDKMDYQLMAFSMRENTAKLLTVESGKYDVLFNKDGQFVNLRYRGPNEPWQKLVNIADLTEDPEVLESIKPINDVQRLLRDLAKVNIPTRIYSQVRVGHSSSSAELNMIEIFPPRFDPKKAHPLLVHVYGGPGSTTVEKGFSVDFQDIVSASLGAVVLIIDPRGTGSDDWKQKSWASKRIGYWEASDVIDVAKDYISRNKYIDAKRTAVWGWSYGGFTTLKTLERDKGEVFKFGMAVAPVTNWLFYNSVYTERYMKSPADNDNYKSTSKITDFEAFKGVSRFLVMAGSADDNVHLQNLFWLTDNLNIHNVENYDMHIFPDSDHSIYYHNANTIIYDKLLNWLDMAYRGLWD